MAHELTATEHNSILESVDQLNDALNDPGGRTAIDWNNVRKILANLIATLGPILLPIFLNLLTPQPPKPAA